MSQFGSSLELFRITIKADSVFVHQKKWTLYIIAENKAKAIEYVSLYLKQGYGIDKVSHLGRELGARMYSIRGFLPKENHE